MARKGKTGNKKPPSASDERPFRPRKYKYLYLIVCEDQNTEPSYFKAFADQFPEGTLYIKPVGTGKDPLGVTREAAVINRSLEDETGREVDHTWIVFDIDDAAKQEKRYLRFEEAFKIAEDAGYKIAWSNEVFELWFLLHLEDIPATPALSRKEVYQLLEDAVRKASGMEEFTYRHGKKEILQVIQQIGDQSAAIRRAEVLEQRNLLRGPINANPCTLVHQLVKELYEWLHFFKEELAK